METTQKSCRKKIKLFFVQFLLCLLPLCLLISLEYTLRLVKKGEERAPFIKRQFKDYSFYIPNRSFYQQFFNIPLHDFVNWDHLDFYVPENKGTNTLRIFVFGESAMYGLESSARQLEVLLEQSFPDKKWEVYNVSCPGINSHGLYFLAKASARLSPDFFIIYMGNNENIGPYGEHSFLYSYPILRNNSIIRLHTYLKSLRIVQFFERGEKQDWREQKPEDLSPYIPKQGQEAKTIELYKKNLKDMIRMGVDVNAYVLVGTLSFNRQFGKKRGEWDSIRFEQTEMNKCIAGVCKAFSERVIRVDIDGILAKKSANGIPDYEYFCDNIHFTFEGNYILACEWFKAICKVLEERKVLEKDKGEGLLNAMDMDTVARFLGWNKATEVLQLQMQKAVITDPVSLEMISQKEAKLSQQITGDIEQEIVEGYLLAYRLNSNDEKIYMQLINWLMKTKRFSEAFELAQEFWKKYPYSRIAMRLLGNVYANMGEFEKSIEMYQKCLHYYSDDGLAQESLKIIMNEKAHLKD